MRSLYEINKDCIDVIENGFSVDEETGEIKFDKTNLDELKAEFEEKIDNISCYIKDLQSLSDSIKAEKEALDKRKKSIDTKVLSLKDYVANVLKSRDMSKFETPRNKLTFRSSKKVEVIDESKIPSCYFNEEIVKKLDKKSVLAELKNGIEIDGVLLQENSNLQIK